jgi:uroporphyrinogen-III synthase
MRVLVTRPAEDGAATAAELARMGHQALLAPLLTTRFLESAPPALGDVQAILATSANGVRAFARLSPRRDLPLFAVGPQTAAAAAAAGFRTVRNANGDAAALAEAAGRWADPGAGALLHVSGEQSAGMLCDALLAAGFSYRKAVLYRMEAATELPTQAAAALAGNTVEAALFFSPRSAGLFARLAIKDGLPLDRLTALCISAATAAALAPLRLAALRIAARPNQAALLARLAE